MIECYDDADFCRSLGYVGEDRIGMGKRVPQNITGA